MRLLATFLFTFLSLFFSFSISVNADALNKFGGNTPISAYTTHSIKATLSPNLSASASIVLPGDAEYEELTTKYSDYNRPTYSAVVAVASIEDVVATVKYARENNIPFLVQSGGHSLTTSTQVTQNAIQINMRRLSYIHFDGERGPEYAVVGGGTLTGEFANATHAKHREVSKLPPPHYAPESPINHYFQLSRNIVLTGSRKAVGSCPCTGVMGIGLGAGIGRLQGLYGYFMDNIVELTLVLYDGSIVKVSETSNTDLWWAVRGAGHNFGVAVEAVIKTHPQLNDGKHFVADMEFPVSRTAELFQLMNEISTPDLPPELSFFITAHYRGKSGKPIINIDFVWHGPREVALPYLQPFLDLSPIFKKEEYVTWDSLPWVTYLELNNILCSQPGGQRNFYAANAATYDISAMVSLFEDWEKTSKEYAGRATFLLMFQTFGQGKVQAVEADSSVFPWRDGAKHFL